MSQVFGRAFELLVRNVVIIVPALAIACISAAVAYVLASSGYASFQFFGDMNTGGDAAFWGFFATIVALALRILGALVAIAFTTGMAAAAWERGTASLADGAQAFRRNGVQVLFALVILFLIGLVASALVWPTFGLSLLAYMVFMIYTMPAVVVGGRPAQDAIVESIRTAAANFGLTLMLVVLIVGIAVVGGLLGYEAGRIPFLGEAVSWIVMEAVVAYATLVVVGEYIKLSKAPREAS